MDPALPRRRPRPCLVRGEGFQGQRQPAESGRAEINLYHHSVLVGLRYALGSTPEPMLAPPPLAAPPTAGAPAVARSYIVYFGLNNASLTGRAREIVAKAAQAARSGKARIKVSSNTDTVGLPRPTSDCPCAVRRRSPPRCGARASAGRRSACPASARRSLQCRRGTGCGCRGTGGWRSWCGSSDAGLPACRIDRTDQSFEQNLFI
jgi:hypothetical protein